MKFGITDAEISYPHYSIGHLIKGLFYLISVEMYLLRHEI
jgi:hypothetical protein